MGVSRIKTAGGKTRYRITYYAKDGKRRGIKLGAETTTKRQADQVETRIITLANAVATDTQADPDTIRWANSVCDDLRAKLISHGLVPHIVKMTLGELCDAFMEHHRGKRKESSIAKYEQTKTSLLEYSGFGRDKLLADITKHEIENWRAWLLKSGNRRDNERSQLDDNTVRRRLGFAKQFFNFAIEKGWISANPFLGFACSVQANADRQHFVKREDIYAAIKHSPNATWKAILALSRFGGLRIPSELWFTWADVDLAGGWIRIQAPKTAHHANRGIRKVPIFLELRPFIEELARLAKPGIETALTEKVIQLPEYKGEGATVANLRSTFSRILRKAGVEPWPKLFHNCRSSRQTELLVLFPIKEVCTWLGNSPTIALAHYAQSTAEQHQRALTVPTGAIDDEGAQGGRRGGHQSGDSTAAQEVAPNEAPSGENQGNENASQSVLADENSRENEKYGRHWTRTSDPRRVKTVL